MDKKRVRIQSDSPLQISPTKQTRENTQANPLIPIPPETQLQTIGNNRSKRQMRPIDRIVIGDNTRTTRKAIRKARTKTQLQQIEKPITLRKTRTKAKTDTKLKTKTQQIEKPTTLRKTRTKTKISRSEATRQQIQNISDKIKPLLSSDIPIDKILQQETSVNKTNEIIKRKLKLTNKLNSVENDEEIRAELTKLITPSQDIPTRITESNQLIQGLFGGDVLSLVKQNGLSLRDMVELQQPKTQGKNVQILAEMIIDAYNLKPEIFSTNETLKANGLRNYKKAKSLLKDFNDKKCYICQGSLDSSTPELEHICPVAEALGILNIIQENGREFMKNMTNNNNFLWTDIAYASMLEYRDAHLCCNRLKSSKSFLMEQSDAGYQVDEAGIKSYLSELFDTIMGENGKGTKPARIYNTDQGCSNKVLRNWFKSFGGKANFIKSRYYGIVENKEIKTPGLLHYVGDIVAYTNTSFKRDGNLAYLIAIANQAISVNEKLWDLLSLQSGNPNVVKKFKLAALQDDDINKKLKQINIPKITGPDCIKLLTPGWNTMSSNKQSYKNTNEKALQIIFDIRKATLNQEDPEDTGDLFAKLFNAEPSIFTLGLDVRKLRSNTDNTIYTRDNQEVSVLNIKNALNIRFNKLKTGYIQSCLAAPDYYDSYPVFLSKQGLDKESIISSCQNNNYMFGMDYMVKLLGITEFSIASSTPESAVKMLHKCMNNVNLFTDIYIYLYILLSINEPENHIRTIDIPRTLNDQMTSGAYREILLNYEKPPIEYNYKQEFIQYIDEIESNTHFIGVSFTITTKNGFDTIRTMNIGVLHNFANFVSTYRELHIDTIDLLYFQAQVLNEAAVKQLPPALQIPNEEAQMITPTVKPPTVKPPTNSKPLSPKQLDVSDDEMSLKSQDSNSDSVIGETKQRGNQFAVFNSDSSTPASQSSTPDSQSSSPDSQSSTLVSQSV